MVAIDLVKNRQTKEPAADERNAIVDACFQRGLLLLGCGASSVRFCPPLVIDKQDVETAVDILDEALTELSRRAAIVRIAPSDPQVGTSVAT
jgi:4-aminobutyrate aminotransferase